MFLSSVHGEDAVEKIVGQSGKRKSEADMKWCDEFKQEDVTEGLWRLQNQALYLIFVSIIVTLSK